MRRVVFVIYEGVQSLDLVGPHEVFEHANSLTGGYRCEVVAPAPGAVRSHSGLSLHAGHGIADLAARAGLSPRHLQRRFTAELGVPPAAYVERVRVEAARRALAALREYA